MLLAHPIHSGENMFEIIWTSQYGTETIDTADTREEARNLIAEYRIAFGQGSFKIKKV